MKPDYSSGSFKTRILRSLFAVSLSIMVLLSGIYPVVYSVFSLIRGRFTVPAYYPYPFFDPEFVWRTLMKDRPMNLFAAYAIIGACVAVVGCGLFMALCAALVWIHNKRIEKE